MVNEEIAIKKYFLISKVIMVNFAMPAFNELDITTKEEFDTHYKKYGFAGLNLYHFGKMSWFEDWLIDNDSLMLGHYLERPSPAFIIARLKIEPEWITCLNSDRSVMAQYFDVVYEKIVSRDAVKKTYYGVDSKSIRTYLRMKFPEYFS